MRALLGAPWICLARQWVSAGNGHILCANAILRRFFPKIRQIEYDSDAAEAEDIAETQSFVDEELDPRDEDDRYGVKDAVAARLWDDVQRHSMPNVSPLVKQWVKEEEGFGLQGVLYIVYKLRLSKRFKEALSVMDWLFNDRPFGELEERLISLHIRLAAHAGNMGRGQEIFYSLRPEQQQTTALRSSLIIGFALRCLLRKAEALFEAFKPNDAEPYFALLRLYCKVGQHDKAAKLYRKMNQAGLAEDVWTVSLLLREKDSYWSLGALDRIQGLEEAAEVLLKKLGAYESPFQFSKQSVAVELMRICAHLGKEAQLRMMWRVIKQEEEGMLINAYLNAIDAFSMIGDLKTAKKIAEDMDSNKQSHFRLSGAIIRMYSRCGMMEKAEEELRKCRQADEGGKKPLFSMYNQLMMGYLANGRPDKAIDTMKMALKSSDRMRPSYLSMLTMLPVFEACKDVETAERMVSRYRGVTDLRLYKGLLRVYIATKRRPLEKFQARLTMNEVASDDEIQRLMNRLRKVAY